MIITSCNNTITSNLHFFNLFYSSSGEQFYERQYRLTALSNDVEPIPDGGTGHFDIDKTKLDKCTYKEDKFTITKVKSGENTGFII